MSRNRQRRFSQRQKVNHVTSEKQVRYQLSQGKQRNREVQKSGSVRSISTVWTERALEICGRHDAVRFWVERGDAGKEACASLTHANTNTLWERPLKEVQGHTLFTTRVRKHAVDPMQRACYQSIAVAREMRVRQEQWRIGVEESFSQERGQLDDTQHAWSDGEHHKMLIPFIKGRRQKVLTRLERSLEGCETENGPRKDFRQDIAKGIEQAASLHLLGSKQLTQWQRRLLGTVHMREFGLALVCSKREGCLECTACGRNHMWRCPEQQCVVTRARFMTKKDEEELRK